MPIPARVAKWLIRAKIAQSIPSIRKIMGEGIHFLRFYSERVLGSPNVELRATQALLDGAGPGVIDLSLGAPWIDVDRAATAVQIDSIASGYPPVLGMPMLRAAVAKKCQQQNNLSLDPLSEIMITTGVSQAIGLVLDSFMDAGDGIAMFDPTFFIYRLAAMNRALKIRSIPSWMESGETKFREQDLRRAIYRSRMLFVNSPSNPTGGMLTQDSLERIAFYCKKRDVLIFSDEVYEQFAFDLPHISIGSLPKVRDLTITANSLSKSHGLTSLRVGYLAASRHLIQPMIVSALATSPFVSELSQRIATEQLEAPPERCARLREECRDRRDWIEREFRRAQVRFDRPSGAFYFWVPIDGLAKSGQEFAERLLHERNVLVMPGQSCGKSGYTYVRLSYAGKDSELKIGIDQFLDFVREKKSQPIPMRNSNRDADPTQRQSRSAA